MSKIENILKPKSKDDIVKSVCKKYNIEIGSDDTQKVMDLIFMTNIIDIKNKNIYYSEARHEKKGSGSYDIIKIYVNQVNIKKVEFKLLSWTEIFNKFIDEVLKISTTPPEFGSFLKDLDLNISLQNRIEAAVNYLAVMTKSGPGNFVIIPKELNNKIKKLNLSLKIIITNKLQNKIIIGKNKPCTNMILEPCIAIFKNKNKYTIGTIGSNPENHYISMNYEI